MSKIFFNVYLENNDLIYSSDRTYGNNYFKTAERSHNFNASTNTSR